MNKFEKKLELFDNKLEEKLDGSLIKLGNKLHVENNRLKSELFQISYSRGGIYSQFKMDCLKSLKEKASSRVVRDRHNKGSFLRYTYPEVDDCFISCVRDTILNTKYVHNLDIIKLNLEIELDIDNEFRKDYNLLGPISLVISILSIKFMSLYIVLGINIMLIIIYLLPIWKDNCRMRYFQNKAILESIKLIEKENLK